MKQRKWGCRTDVAGVDRELVKMQGSKGRWTTHPQALFFFFVFPNSVAFPLHSQDTSEQTGSRWRRKGEKREKERV